MNAKSAEQFPIEVSVGSVVVKVYKTESRGYPLFQVSDHSSGTRKLRSFADLSKARTEAKRIARMIANGQIAAAQLTADDCATYVRAKEILAPSGVAIEEAVRTFAEACELLGGDRILEACRDYALRNPAGMPTKPVREAVDEFLAAQAQNGKSPRYVKDLRSRLGQLATAFDGPLSSITGARLQEWLSGRGLAPQSLLNFTRVFGAFANFCKRRGWLARTWDELDRIERPRVKGGAVEIFTPDEIARLLAAARPVFVPALAIAAFAGLRTAEVTRLDWRNVRLADEFIEITADAAKTASRRLVPIPANLAAWLAPYARAEGRVWPRSLDGLGRAQQKTARRAGVPWKANACRHSFISYRLATIQNAAQVALEAGNSPQMVFRHYREVVRPADAARWFAVAPAQPANVVPVAAATAA